MQLGVLLAAAAALIPGPAAAERTALFLGAADPRAFELDGIEVTIALGIASLTTIAVALSGTRGAVLRPLVATSAALNASALAVGSAHAWLWWVVATATGTWMLRASGAAAVARGLRFAWANGLALGIIAVAGVVSGLAEAGPATSSALGALPGPAAWLLLAGWVCVAGISPFRSGSAPLLEHGGLTVALSGLTWWLAAFSSVIRHVAVRLPGWWVEQAPWIAGVGVALALIAPCRALARTASLGRFASVPALHRGLALAGLAVWTRPSIVGAVALLVAGAGATAGLLVLASATRAVGFDSETAAARPLPDTRSATRALWIAASAGPATLGLVGAFHVGMAAMARFPGVAMLVALSTFLAAYAAIQATRAPSVPSADLADRSESDVAGLRALIALLTALVVTLGLTPDPVLRLAQIGARRALAPEVPLQPADPEIGSEFDRRMAAGSRRPAPTSSAEQMAQEEADVGRTLGQPPHEPGIPAGSVADVDTHRVPVAHELSLQRPADAIEHLELPVLRPPAIDDLAPVSHESRIMRGDGHANTVAPGVVPTSATSSGSL